MDKEKIKQNLNKYDFKYVEKGEVITVKLDFSHDVSIHFNNGNKIIITDRLVHWNFLTGGIQMSLKNSMIYSFIGLIFGGFIFNYFLMNNNFNAVFLFMTYGFWVVLFTIYYLIKFEGFKQQINNWTNN